MIDDRSVLMLRCEGAQAWEACRAAACWARSHDLVQRVSNKSMNRYGHVKERSIRLTMEKKMQLLAAFRSPPQAVVAAE